jgi:two-component system, sensor histidine kinase and response regulator
MSKGRILIVEDDTHLLNGIRDILTLEEYEVLTAENGKQALELLHSQRLPALIVSDIMMPIMDGLQFLEEVRKIPEWVEIPFIFLTAKNEPHDIIRGKILGSDDHLGKPFDAEQLVKAVEARLARHRQIRELRDRSLGDLKKNILMILNHEFRTPLTLVVAYADMLNDPSAVELNRQELASFIKGVSSGAERLRRLVENFIQLVELETGEAAKVYQWRKAPINDLENLLQTACNSQRNNPKFEQELHLSIEPPIPPFVADREYLITAVAQLLDNASKFSTPDRPITVTARSDFHTIEISVKDEGRGIHAHSLDDIFKAFHQENREKFEQQGAGSGLAIVRGIAELHGGQVWVSSEVGKGSVFKLQIPIIAPTSNSAPIQNNYTDHSR